MKLSDDVIEESFTDTVTIVELDFHAPRNPLGVPPDRIADSGRTNVAGFSIGAHNDALIVVKPEKESSGVR